MSGAMVAQFFSHASCLAKRAFFRFPDDIRDRIITLALDYVDLSPSELIGSRPDHLASEPSA
ncbi:hypothetical protein ACC713_29595 [Rhizobium johnstonii]|uniref:hypothetical protein n=1 Tax=Rhizobium johnstonii TaxID=3019933 RepID=UPI003F9B67B5